MSKKRKARQARLARRRENLMTARALVHAALHNPPPPPCERDEITPEVEAQIADTENVKDIPLALLNIHKVHGKRNPYLNTPEGLVRRRRCHAHIRRARGWDQTACQVLTVFLDRNGDYWIIDGAGRLYMAAELAGGVVRALPCKILTGLSEAQIIILFKRMGTEISRVSQFDAWAADKGVRGHEEVAKIIAIIDSFGFHFPKVTLPVLLFGYSLISPATNEPVLSLAVADVINTSAGLNRKHTSVFTSSISALRGTNEKFNTERIRQVIGEGDEYYAARMVEKAKAIANDLGYLRPTMRTIAWQLAKLLGADYNSDLKKLPRLQLSALDTLVDPHGDAYSTAPPPKKVPKKPKWSVEVKPIDEHYPGQPGTSVHPEA